MQDILLIDHILFVAAQQHITHPKHHQQKHGLQSTSDLRASAKLPFWSHEVSMCNSSSITSGANCGTTEVRWH